MRTITKYRSDDRKGKKTSKEYVGHLSYEMTNERQEQRTSTERERKDQRENS